MRLAHASWTFALAMPLAFTVFVAGCGGGGSGGSSGATSGTGTVAISMRDAPSDHISRFEVDVTAVDLVREDGLSVSVLPGRTRLDLAQLVTVSQLLTVQAVPRGVYTSMKISFDCAQASVSIDGSVNPASLFDPSGAPLTGIVTREIDLSAHKVECLPGLTRYIEVDFDLDASCVIDAAQNRVTLGPVLKADTEPSRPVDTKIFGILSEIQSGANGQAGTFTIELRAPGAGGTGPKVLITTSANTTILVEGKPSSFDALRTFPINGPISAQGQLSAGRDTLVATRVEAMQPRDVVDGVVMKRTADGTLTVAGRSVDFPAGTIRTGTFTVLAKGARVNVGAGAPPAPGTTAPVGSGTPPLTHDAIAVGQKIDCRGELSGDVLDATKDHVVLVGTHVTGLALAAPSGGVLLVSLDRVCGFPASDLDWSVGGTPSADPKKFAVSTSTLTVSSIGSGTPVAIHGVLTPWGSPSSAPDMNALSIADRTNVTAVLQCDWSTPTAKPFAALAATGFTLDLSAANRKQVDLGQATPQALAASDKPATQPGANGKFSILENGTVTTYGDMASFSAAATQRLATKKARGVNAIGQWDAAQKKMVAQQVTLGLE